MQTFEVRSGYKATEMSTYRNPVDVEEMAAHCDKHSHITLRDCKGNARTVKVNGKVRLWKRDPSRIEVPFKYGMYEYGTNGEGYFRRADCSLESSPHSLRWMWMETLT